jgi:signal transduction histidine kinase
MQKVHRYKRDGERVNLVNGKLTLESHPGMGTKILIELPIHREPAADE